MSGSKTQVLLTETEDECYGHEAIESMAHCIQGLFLQDEGSGESQARYGQHSLSHLCQRQTRTQASAVDTCILVTVI